LIHRKKSFYLPTRFVQLRNSECRHREVVGEKRQPLRGGGIDVAHAPQRAGIRASRLGGRQADCVIGLQARGEVHRTRHPRSEPNPFLRARQEERRFVGEAMQAFEIDIAAVHDVDGAGLDHQIIDERHIRAFSLGNVDHGRDQAAQVDLRMELDGRVPSTL